MQLQACPWPGHCEVQELCVFFALQSILSLLWQREEGSEASPGLKRTIWLPALLASERLLLYLSLFSPWILVASHCLFLRIMSRRVQVKRGDIHSAGSVMRMRRREGVTRSGGELTRSDYMLLLLAEQLGVAIGQPAGSEWEAPRLFRLQPRLQET